MPDKSPYYGFSIPLFILYLLGITLTLLGLTFLVFFWQKPETDIAKDEPSVPLFIVEHVTIKVSQDISDYLGGTCVALEGMMADSSTVRIGTGFLIEDELDSSSLFFVTALHNFYNPPQQCRKSISWCRELRNPVFLIIPCKRNGLDSMKYCQEIETKEAIKSGLLLFYPDSIFNTSTWPSSLAESLFSEIRIDLAVYHFRKSEGVAYRALNNKMISPDSCFEQDTDIFYVGFGRGYTDTRTGLRKTFHKSGQIKLVADADDMPCDYGGPLWRGYALLEIFSETMEGESGCPVFIRPDKSQDVDRIKLCGLLIKKLGVLRFPEAKMVLACKVKELMSQFNSFNQRAVDDQYPIK